MFSGITQGLFPVSALKRQKNLLQYAVDLPPILLESLRVGASVSVNGVCQTVVSIQQNAVWFDAMQETLDKTTLNQLQVGERVSIERSLRFGDEVGGHVVSGHVYGTAVITKKHQQGLTLSLSLHCDPTWMKYILPKGFIAMDGCSLTVGDISPKEGLFTVYLIPETLRLTNFSSKKQGERVNIELDHQTRLIVDTVEHFLAEKMS